MVKHYEVHVIVQDIEHQLQKLFFIIFFIIVFYKIFIQLTILFHPLKIYWRLLSHCPTIWIIYIPILKIWRFLILIIIFNVFIISFCISIEYSSCNTYLNNISPLIPFSTIYRILIFTKRLIRDKTCFDLLRISI